MILLRSGAMAHIEVQTYGLDEANAALEALRERKITCRAIPQPEPERP